MAVQGIKTYYILFQYSSSAPTMHLLQFHNQKRSSLDPTLKKSSLRIFWNDTKTCLTLTKQKKTKNKKNLLCKGKVAQEIRKTLASYTGGYPKMHMTRGSMVQKTGGTLCGWWCYTLLGYNSGWDTRPGIEESSVWWVSHKHPRWTGSHRKYTERDPPTAYLRSEL